jgi:hypothetical protein
LQKKDNPTMRYTGPFSTLNLMMIPRDENTCIYNDEFVLADNFYGTESPTDLTADSATAPFITSSYPFKIEFTMAMLCLGGSIHVRLNLTQYKLRRNHLLIVQLGDIGQCLEISPDCRVAIIAFSDNKLITEVSPQGAVAIRKYLSATSLLRLTDEETQEILDTYQAIRKKIQQPRFLYKREILISYLQVLYCIGCQLMSPTSTQETEPQNRKAQIFGHFMQLLKEHCTTQRKIGFYADKLCMTPKYLSQVIHAVSGRHAGDWIRDYVILEAKVLLKSRQYTIQQVSDMLNFPNQSFFGTYFKKAVGCSPLTYLNER